MSEFQGVWTDGARMSEANGIPFRTGPSLIRATSSGESEPECAAIARGKQRQTPAARISFMNR